MTNQVREPTTIDARPPPEAPAALSALGLGTVLIGAFLPMADFFIVNVALPTIQTTLHASAAALELVVAGYGLAYAMLLVLGGRLGDALGRRPLFLAGMAAFTATSLACGLAPTAGTLVAARVAQGASAAMMVPQVLATIQTSTAGAGRARALGLYAATGGIAGIVGQLAGGLLVSADLAGTSWRLIFLVNVPVGLVGLVLAARLLPASSSTDPSRADLRGTALLGTAVLCLLVPLMVGHTLGWPAWLWMMLAIAPEAAVGFVRTEQRVERAGGVALVPPSLLRLPGMRRGLGLAVPFFAGFGGFMFVFAVTLQRSLGFGALASGLALLPMMLGFLVASVYSARLVARYGRRVLTGGALVQGAGLAMVVAAALADWPHLGVAALAPGTAVAGIGQGLIMSPLFRVVLADVPPGRAGVAGGVLTTTQQTSLALGVATLGTLYLSLSAEPGWGVRDAFIAVLAVQITVAGALAAWSRRLPDSRKTQAQPLPRFRTQQQGCPRSAEQLSC
ncbi:MAG: MFS transporter [Pseudonocardiaceae bacterium]